MNQEIQLPIYLDNHATTPIDPRVLDEMIPTFSKAFGNPASLSHVFGWDAIQLVDDARVRMASLLGCLPEEIVTTSGATESINLAIKGVADVYREKGNHIITQVTEHNAVLDTCRYLEKKGMKVTYLPVDHHGMISVDALREAVTDETILISVMFANNEIGTIQPIEAVGKIAKEREVLFHVDAAQTAGKIPIDVDAMGIDLLSFSAHKMYGPKGVGALYVRRKNPRVRLTPLIHGGGHQFGMRSGTLNVTGIVGFGKACEIASREMADEEQRLGKLRDRLHRGLEQKLGPLHVNGHPEKRLAHSLNISFDFVEGEALLSNLGREIAVSSSSACTSAKAEASHVLKALGLPASLLHNSIRFGIGRFTTEQEIDYVIERVARAVITLRELSPFYEKK